MSKKRRDERLRKLLSRYFDLKGKTATITLSYDGFEDLVTQSFGKDDVNMLDSRLFEDIQSAFDLIPTKYDINLNLNLGSFDKYPPEKVKEIIESNIALKFYSIGLKGIRKNILHLSTMGLGVAILIISYALSYKNLPTIVYDVVNITGTLFIWEAVSALFLQDSYVRWETSRLVSKMKRITVCGPDGQRIECSMPKRRKRGR